MKNQGQVWAIIYDDGQGWVRVGVWTRVVVSATVRNHV